MAVKTQAILRFDPSRSHQLLIRRVIEINAWYHPVNGLVFSGFIHTSAKFFLDLIIGISSDSKSKNSKIFLVE